MPQKCTYLRDPGSTLLKIRLQCIFYNCSSIDVHPSHLLDAFYTFAHVCIYVYYPCAVDHF